MTFYSYLIDFIGVETGFPYGNFSYGIDLGPRGISRTVGNTGYSKNNLVSLVNYLTSFYIILGIMAKHRDYNDAKPIEELDNGMGDTVGMLRSDLLDSIDTLAKELGIDLPKDNELYDFSYSDEHSTVIVKAKSYGDVFQPIAITTAFLVDDSYHEPVSHQNSNDWEIRLGNDTIEVHEGNLRASGSYFN